MKGDINLKINKKMGLAILASLGVFAMADYVSLINAKDSGGIIYEKETMTVGAVVFRMDDTNPADIYGGTWELLTKNSTLNFGDGTNQDGTPSGDNNPLVPVALHSHGMNHDHGAANTSAAGAHAHVGGIGIHNNYNNQYAASAPFGVTNRAASYNGFQFNAWVHNADFPNTSTVGNHSHSVDLPNYNGNTASSGVSNATIDVRGQIITINVWKRTN